MENKNIVFGMTNLGLIFVLESRLQEVITSYEALESAKTWGEFKELVSPKMYELFKDRSSFYDIPDAQLDPDTPFTPNDVFSPEAGDFICNPDRLGQSCLVGFEGKEVFRFFAVQAMQENHSFERHIEALTRISKAITSDRYIEDILRLVVTVTAETMRSKI